MNDCSNYQSQSDEIIEEFGNLELAEIQDNERVKSLSSYPDGDNVEIRYCSICGQPLRYRSMAYEEGFHFDYCL